jgi:hypothetical protein
MRRSNGSAQFCPDCFVQLLEHDGLSLMAPISAPLFPVTGQTFEHSPSPTAPISAPDLSVHVAGHLSHDEPSGQHSDEPLIEAGAASCEVEQAVRAAVRQRAAAVNRAFIV